MSGLNRREPLDQSEVFFRFNLNAYSAITTRFRDRIGIASDEAGLTITPASRWSNGPDTVLPEDARRPWETSNWK